MTYIKKDKTILIGPTGFLGPAFLEKDPSIIAVGRSKLPEHLTNDFFYIENMNLRLDIKILLKTIFVVIQGHRNQ